MNFLWSNCQDDTKKPAPHQSKETAPQIQRSHNTSTKQKELSNKYLTNKYLIHFLLKPKSHGTSRSTQSKMQYHQERNLSQRVATNKEREHLNKLPHNPSSNNKGYKPNQFAAHISNNQASYIYQVPFKVC